MGQLPEGYMVVRRADAREPNNDVAELMAAIDADREAGRTLPTGSDLGLIGTVVRFCLSSDGISLSASDALSLCRAALVGANK